MKRQRVGIACDKCRDLKAKVRACTPLTESSAIVVNSSEFSVMGDNLYAPGAKDIASPAPGLREDGVGLKLAQPIRTETSVIPRSLQPIYPQEEGFQASREPLIHMNH